MYSEVIQKLNRKELESLSESLEIAISTHLRWLSKVNHALVCDEVETLSLCPDSEPYKQCQFGQWVYKVTNEALLQEPHFIELKALHKAMHMKVCKLTSELGSTQRVTDQSYQRFIALQSEFFNVLQTMRMASMESLGNIDFLTSLPNRRAFDQVLYFEKNRLARHGQSASIAIVDIDYFKQVNDNYGHDAGDRVLVQISEIFLANVRVYDTVARFGGEEFVFYMPQTTIDEASRLLERIRKQIEISKFGINEEITVHITCSIGLCSFDREIQPADALIKADASLYKAKRSGRNKIVISSP